MRVVLLARVAATSAEVAATSARSAKVGLIAACLREAAPVEVAPLVAYLSGDLPQRRTGVGWASLRDVPAPAEVATLTIAEVDGLLTTIAELAGKGSQAERARLVGALFGRATKPEQHLLRGLLSGELRQGALEGVMVDAVARAVWSASGLITFFTAGEPEVRAWPCESDAPAPIAAGVIHTDFIKKFIRAEVTSVEELVAAGSMEALRTAGKLRVEGKEYRVKDGDTIFFRIGG
jgi:hypothetical protein